MSDKVLLDLNNPIFQEDLFSLPQDDALRIFRGLRKIRKLSWAEVYKDKGLRWEMIQSKTGPDGQRLYTIRITQGFRALVYRQGEFMRFLSPIRIMIPHIGDLLPHEISPDQPTASKF